MNRVKYGAGLVRVGLGHYHRRSVVSPTSETSFHHHTHRLDMTLAVTETLSPNKPNLHMTLAVTEALIPNKPNQTSI